MLDGESAFNRMEILSLRPPIRWVFLCLGLYLYNKVEQLLYILIGCFLITLYLLYRVDYPKKPPKITKKSEKPTIWHRIKK